VFCVLDYCPESDVKKARSHKAKAKACWPRPRPSTIKAKTQVQGRSL